MKLTKLILELEKNKWTNLKSSELDYYSDQIINLIKNAYKEIGGHPNFNDKGDVTPNQLYTVIDLDDDPNIDAVGVTKRKPAGIKHVATGHDGQKPSKRAVVNKKADELKKSGHYIEVSGRIKDILLAKGVPIVTDKNVIKKALKGKDIKFVGNEGEYIRKIGGTPHKKILLGHPKI